MSMSRRALLLLAVTTLLAGCAGIPTSGPVREGGDLRLQRVQDVVPFIGEPPAPGATPEDIVRGFLQSGADFVNDHEVARTYLTAAVAQRWRPRAGTVVYERVAADPAVTTGSVGTVTIKGTEAGRIDAEGGFSRTPAATALTREFRLQRVHGEWRISGLEDGLLLSVVDVVEAYRQVALYFLAPSGSSLVPDVVLVPELPGLTTTMVTRLLRGPTRSLSASVGSGFPSGTELEVGSVPVRDGVATVRLDSSALTADDRAREQMSAQLVWTLTQLPGVSTVRVTAGGEDLAVPGAAVEQDRASWGGYDPDILPGAPSAHLALDGVIGRYLDGEFEPVPGAAGAGKLALRSPAVALDGTRLAAVSADGSAVLVGRLAVDAPLEVRVTGADLSAPSWDPGDNLWVVDRATGSLWYLADGAESPQEVAVPRPLAGDRRLTGVSVSRDGSRIALLVGSGPRALLRVGGVQRVESPDPEVPGGQTLSIVAVEDPLPDVTGVRDVAWADSSTLAVLGSRDGDPAAPFYLGVDGYEIRPVEPLADLVGLAAVPSIGAQDQSLVGSTADGQVWQLTLGGGWRVLGPGADPAYPG